MGYSKPLDNTMILAKKIRAPTLRSEKKMTRTELNILQTTLNSKRVELTRALALRDGIAIGGTPVQLDEVQIGADSEFRTKCLLAVPWATLCVAYREQADCNPEPNFASQERFLRDHA